MPTTKIEFEGSQGDTLQARLDLPNGLIRAHALFAHCFTCSKDIAAASRIARGLSERGIAVLRFDFTGLGHSDGEFANTNFSSNVQDLVKAADWLRVNREAPAVLIGHSLGGAAVLAAAGEIDECKAVATLGAPADPSHVAHLFGPSRAEIEEKGEAEVVLAGRPFLIRRQFLEDIESQRLSQRIGSLRRALLILHSPVDEIVSVDNAATIFMAAKHPKSFVSLDRADHLLTRPEDAEYVATLLGAWASRYVVPEEAAKVPPEGEVVVAETGMGRFQNDVFVGRHHLLAGEPRSAGGDDVGPAPYDYLLAALGTCTSMTLRMYAERKGLSVDQLSVRLRHEKIHVDDCTSCTAEEKESLGPGARIDHIDRVIKIVGDLSPEQHKRMLEIADRCPVHRTLEGKVSIETSPE